MLDTLQPGLFAPYIAPIRDRLIRIQQMAARPADLDVFRTLATAVLECKQLRMLYHGRASDETTERTVSPQRLAYYRSNWYLDTWCHPAQRFDEQWHPEQESTVLSDGEYELKVPYSRPEELVMDILKYGAEVRSSARPRCADRSCRRSTRRRNGTRSSLM